jgi:hypothetical protein
LLDRTFLGGREFRLQLVGDAFGNVALDGEDVGQIAIVGLRPEVHVVAGVDQLRDHAHFVGRALHAALDHMRHAQLLSNLSQIALRSCLVLHHRSPADHAQVGNLGQMAQNLILHAIREERVFRIAAQILERKNRD